MALHAINQLKRCQASQKALMRPSKIKYAPNNVKCVSNGVKCVSNGVKCVSNGVKSVSNDVKCVSNSVKCVAKYAKSPEQRPNALRKILKTLMDGVKSAGGRPNAFKRSQNVFQIAGSSVRCLTCPGRMCLNGRRNN